MADVNIRHFAGHGHEIIGHIGVGELAALIINAFFEQGCAQALHYATAYLLVDELWIDDRPAILDHPVFEQLDETGFGIDFEP